MWSADTPAGEVNPPSRKNLSILYLGPDAGTSRHRAAALRRMGYDVAIVDPWRSIPRSRLMKKWLHHSGALFLGSFIEKRILAALPAQDFDLVWVDGGGLVSASLVRELKKRFGRVINYNLDDPFGTRDGRKWRHYLTAIPNYDLVVVVRECNVAEAAGRGAKDVLLVSRSADEVAHKRQTLDQSDFSKWSSEVVFVGTWMPERGPFLSRLIELGVPLAIYGDRWDRAAEWPILKQHWRGPGLYIDEEYSKAIQAAKLCIGLLSVGNRDTCTQRSFEVPYLQSVLCAERTSEHLSLYQEDAEAVFWNTAEECAEKCRELLADPVRRAELAARGRARCLRNGTTNEQVLHQILSRTFPQKKEHSLRAKAAASAR